MKKPFFFYSASLPDFLYQEKASLIFSTYQAGKVLFVSSVAGKALNIYAKNFDRPMGIAINSNKLAIAHKSKIDFFSGSNILAKSFPSKQNYYDRIFVPQLTYNTGIADIHEIEWGNNKLWAVNTAFSCLCQMNEDYSFIPSWKPDFISKIVPEDRCHLNGLAMYNGKPKYVTAFDKTDYRDGWRNNNVNTGIIIDVETNEIIVNDLPMPHSPACNQNGELFFLLSATGEVAKYDFDNKNYKIISKVNGFLRGLEIYGHYLIVGMSALRDSSKAFDNISENIKNGTAGIYIIDTLTGEDVARITFTEYINEIFAVRLLKNTIRPAILSTNDKEASEFIHLPNNVDYWLQKQKLDNK